MSFYQRLRSQAKPVVLGILMLGALFGGISGYVMADGGPAVEAAPEAGDFARMPANHPVISEAIAEDAVVSEAVPAGEPVDPEDDCGTCHGDVVATWSDSIHAHAYEDEYFQEAWAEQDNDPACLACHTTGFVPATGEYDNEGVSCVACHGEIPSAHPSEPVDGQLAHDACQDCHTTTQHEFEMSLHSTTSMECVTCHFAHDNGLREEESTDLCLNCHGAALDGFVHTTHIEGDLTCRDCHGWIDPNMEVPVTGVGYTGHDFVATLPACVDCHENDVDLALVSDNRDMADTSEAQAEAVLEGQEALLRVQQLEATIETVVLQNRNQSVMNIALGAVFGTILGGFIVWFFSRTYKPISDEED